MLFNSYTLLLVFLPITVIGFHLLRRTPFRVAASWLVLMSLVYYGYWNPDPTEPWTPKYLILILASCLANFGFGRFFARRQQGPGTKTLLAFGVCANLALLGYYKYLGFFASISQSLSGYPTDLPSIALPLGISFFTFQQIAYLVDAYRGETQEYHLTDYLLFVTFFPQLIAGPIVHHREMMPQFMRRQGRGVRGIDISIGITMLAIGLFKKVVIADTMARGATPIFELSEAGARLPTAPEAWFGAGLYSLQIYFDFSGYSDMALGCARLFGIRLPLNFNSPYKSLSIIDFWRRWHLTLSRFLRDYLYIPLGGSRCSKPRRYQNLLMTMLLGGLWHGAGWTFVIWGGLHGLYLCINHFWSHLQKLGRAPRLPNWLAVAVTFLAVMLAWVYFRAPTLESANTMISSMFSGAIDWPEKADRTIRWYNALLLIIGGLVIAMKMPNTQQIMARYRPAVDAPRPEGRRHRWQWRPTPLWAGSTLVLILVTYIEFDKVSEFIYFQF